MSMFHSHPASLCPKVRFGSFSATGGMLSGGIFIISFPLHFYQLFSTWVYCFPCSLCVSLFHPRGCWNRKYRTNHDSFVFSGTSQGRVSRERVGFASVCFFSQAILKGKMGKGSWKLTLAGAASPHHRGGGGRGWTRMNQKQDSWCFVALQQQEECETEMEERKKRRSVVPKAERGAGMCLYGGFVILYWKETSPLTPPHMHMRCWVLFCVRSKWETLAATGKPPSAGFL